MKTAFNSKFLYDFFYYRNDRIIIMLLGRPYNVLSPALNGHIPEIIEKKGIRAFFMDMIPSKNFDAIKTEELITTIQWKFASKILHSAEVVAGSEKLCGSGVIHPDKSLLLLSFPCGDFGRH
jgi:predicted nucleotide-binding protein (sugar kinase/HSP70/actin superfamily)